MGPLIRFTIANLLIRFGIVSIALAASGCATANLTTPNTFTQDTIAWRAGKNCGPPSSGTMTIEQAGKCIPVGLEEPEKWVFVGVQDVPGKSRLMSWHKVIGKDPGQYDELFEFTNVQRPPVTTAQYLEFVNKKSASDCPSAKVETIKISDNELILETKVTSPACIGGIHDELDRTLFGAHDLFSFVYMVKRTSDMTPAQRAAGMVAITSPVLHPAG